ncbi:MAG: siderophore-interacting protein [Actinomycetota bacterium]
MTVLDAIPTHVTAVARTERLSARFVRVTLTGDLGRFRPVGPDQFVYLLLPPPGRTELTVDTSFTWTGYEAMPEADRPVGAYYTVRAHRPEVGELDLDVFLHDPVGPGSGWAATVSPGAPAALWGPRTAWAPPATTRRWLLVADESGVSALEAVVAARPPGVAVTAVVEASDPTDLVDLDLGVEVHHLWRGEAPAGTTDLLVEAVRRLELEPTDLYAWGGAESRAMRDVRRHLRSVVGLAREQVSMTPYWRHPRHATDPLDED